MQTIVIGHKNPDMDSICAAIAYAELKRLSGHAGVIAARAGNTNERIDFVLGKFGVEAPLLINDLSPRVSDVMEARVMSVRADSPVYDALQLIDKKRLREQMKDSGIGTPATRAAIIERLITVGYVERDGRSLQATEKGLNVIRLLDEHALTSPGLTGSWEQRLGRIERGEESRKKFMSDIAGFAEQTVHKLDETLKDVKIPRAGKIIIIYKYIFRNSAHISKSIINSLPFFSTINSQLTIYWSCKPNTPQHHCA